MLLELPIILLSNAYYTPIIPSCVPLYSKHAIIIDVMALLKYLMHL